MQQQLMQMQQPMMAGAFNTTITSDHIQQYLDENKSLILKILDNQNSGKLSECAENQARLQRNLMYLASIADCQPQPSSVYAQTGTNYLHQQSQQMVSQSLLAARSPMYLQRPPYSASQQQQAPYSQSAGSSAIHMLQSQSSVEAAPTGAYPGFGLSSTAKGLQGSSKGAGSASNQDIRNAGSAEVQGSNSGREEG